MSATGIEVTLRTVADVVNLFYSHPWNVSEVRMGSLDAWSDVVRGGGKPVPMVPPPRLLGFPVIICEDMPKDRVALIDPDGKVLTAFTFTPS